MSYFLWVVELVQMLASLQKLIQILATIGTSR